MHTNRATNPQGLNLQRAFELHEIPLNRYPKSPHHPIPHIDVEPEFDECVSSIGGQRVAEIVGHSPNFRNADYIFADDVVVAELKCLEEDKGRDEALKEKVHRLYNQYFDTGKTDLIIYGEVEINANDVSEDFGRDIMELYRRPIQRVIKTANKQIRQTKIHLNLNEYYGVLLLVNDGHELLSPAQVHWIIANTFKRNSYSSIDLVIFFTVNLLAYHESFQDDLLVWSEWGRADHEMCSEEFLTKLRTAWFEHHQSLADDIPVRIYTIDDSTIYAGLENVRTKKR